MSEAGASNLSTYLSDIVHLDRRLSRAIETRRSIQLSALELDLLCATGAYEALKDAAVKEQKRQALDRLGIEINAPTKEPPDAAPSDKAVFTPDDLAKRWNIPRAAVHTAIKKGELRAFQLGPKLYRVRREAAEEYEQRLGR